MILKTNNTITQECRMCGKHILYKKQYSYVSPYTEVKLTSQLQGADGQKKAGVLVVGKMKKDVPGHNRPIPDEEKWVFYIMPPNEWMPKE